MKNLGMILVLLMSASSALAVGIDARSMTCDEVQDIVNRDGEVTIMHRPIGSMTYYRDRERCDQFPWEAIASPGYEPTSDMHRCLVGWRCDFRGGH